MFVGHPAPANDLSPRRDFDFSPGTTHVGLDSSVGLLAKLQKKLLSGLTEILRKG